MLLETRATQQVVRGKGDLSHHLVTIFTYMEENRSYLKKIWRTILLGTEQREASTHQREEVVNLLHQVKTGFIIIW